MELAIRKKLEQEKAKMKMNMLITDIQKGPELPEIKTARADSKQHIKKGGLTKNKSMGRLL